MFSITRNLVVLALISTFLALGGIYKDDKWIVAHTGCNYHCDYCVYSTTTKLGSSQIFITRT